MNDTSNPNSSPPQPENPPRANGNAGPQPGHSVLESLCSAVNEGAQQAKAAAEKAIPKIKAAASEATYWMGFGASFATVFSYTVARELAPQVLKAGVRDGAQAGAKSGEEWASKVGRKRNAAEAPSGSAPSDPATQPGLA
jgi:hypothetical protein